MNIFTLDRNPRFAAQMMCDKHINKMCVEGMQCLVSALLKCGAPPEHAPRTSLGQPHKGGYRNHPVVFWVAESHENFSWLKDHVLWLCHEFKYRYGKEHLVESQLVQLGTWCVWAQYIPHTDECGEYKHEMIFERCFKQSQGLNEDLLEWEDDIEAAREFYFRDKKGFAEWKKGRDAPAWWLAKVGDE
jgi:hypothetical protein